MKNGICVVAFTGTRNGMSRRQLSALDQFIDGFMWKNVAFVHGGCVGADAEFHKSVVAKNFKPYVYPSTIEQLQGEFEGAAYVFKRLPPLERNRLMVDVADILLAAPQTLEETRRSGTWATIRYARKKNVPCFVLDP